MAQASSLSIVSPGIEVPDDKVLTELRSFEDWYETATTRWGRALFVARTAVLLSGFLVALLTGLTVGRTSNQDAIKIAVICLSAVGTLGASILSQYRVGEIERLRADGRIACQKLRQDAEYKLPGLHGEARTAFISELFERLNMIENKQNDGFYLHFSGKHDHRG